MKKISLLGASGYIGRSLAPLFMEQQTKYELHLFSRTPDVLAKQYTSFTDYNLQPNVHPLGDFTKIDCDVVINATGIGDSREIAKDPRYILEMTSSIDDVIISKLKAEPEITYVNFSSGAVHGARFDKVISNDMIGIDYQNNLSVSESYALAKLQSEAKHRTLADLSIIDVRVFAFFSQFVDVTSTFLMSEIAGCLERNEVFRTNNIDIIRDYITPRDLFHFLECIISSPRNCAYDVYSLEPVSKFTLLDYLRKKYNLQYEVSNLDLGNASLAKDNYYSTNHQAEEINYSPSYTSLAGICRELDLFLGKIN